MLKIWIEYIWNVLASLLHLQPNFIEGSHAQNATFIVLAYIIGDIYQRRQKRIASSTRGKTTCEYSAMTDKDKQVAIVGEGNREVDSESTSETTLTEISKDLGHTKSLEKKAEYEEHNKESIVEDHRTQTSESSKQVTQSVKQEVSENRQVTHTSFSSSESFSMEETEEYEYQGDGTTLALKEK